MGTGGVGSFVILPADDTASQSNFGVGSNTLTVNTSSGVAHFDTTEMNAEQFANKVQEFSEDVLDNLEPLFKLNDNPLSFVSNLGFTKNYRSGMQILLADPWTVDNVPASFTTNFSAMDLYSPYATAEFINATSLAADEKGVFLPSLSGIRLPVSIAISLSFIVWYLILACIALFMLDNFSMSMNGAHAGKMEKGTGDCMYHYSISFYRGARYSLPLVWILRR